MRHTHSKRLWGMACAVLCQVQASQAATQAETQARQAPPPHAELNSASGEMVNWVRKLAYLPNEKEARDGVKQLRADHQDCVQQARANNWPVKPIAAWPDHVVRYVHDEYVSERAYVVYTTMTRYSLGTEPDNSCAIKEDLRRGAMLHTASGMCQIDFTDQVARGDCPAMPKKPLQPTSGVKQKRPEAPPPTMPGGLYRVLNEFDSVLGHSCQKVRFGASAEDSLNSCHVKAGGFMGFTRNAFLPPGHLALTLKEEMGQGKMSAEAVDIKLAFKVEPRLFWPHVVPGMQVNPQ